MGIKARIGLGVVGFLLACGLAQAAGVQAKLDRHHVTLGDSVTLTLTFPGVSSADMPDLSPLRKDFRIGGQSSSATQSWVNGAVHASYVIQLSLQPRHAGTLRIPPLEAGGKRTQALSLKVSAPSGKALGKPGDPAYVKVTLDTHTPYVGEQVALDLRLFYTDALTNGNLPDPVVDGAKVQRLGREQRYQTMRDGNRYAVVERHYALVPQRAGTLTVPPVVFRGQALNQTRMGDFFSNVRRVGAQSGTQTLTVKPRPATSGKGPWLPARQVEINLSGLPASGKVQVGEPVTVTLQEGATGLAATDLPEPSLPKLPGADVYPDHTQDVTRNNGQWITGSRTRSFAIVPSRTGTLRIPEITLNWWNVVKDREETTRIPAHVLNVQPAAGQASGPARPSTTGPAAAVPPPAASVAASVTPSSKAAPKPGPPTTQAGRAGATTWRRVALASLLLWLLSVLAVAAWWLLKRGPGKRDTAKHGNDDRSTGQARTLRNAFLATARRGDLRASAHALLAWAQAEVPDVRHLQDLASRLRDARQREVIQALEQDLYGRGEPTLSGGDDIVPVFRQGFAWTTTGASRPREDLPPLYPTR